MAETETQKPTAGAMRAAGRISKHHLSYPSVHQDQSFLARIIDAETGLPELLEACKRLLFTYVTAHDLGPQLKPEKRRCLYCGSRWSADNDDRLREGDWHMQGCPVTFARAAIAKAKREGE